MLGLLVMGMTWIVEVGVRWGREDGRGCEVAVGGDGVGLDGGLHGEVVE